MGWPSRGQWESKNPWRGEGQVRVGRWGRGWETGAGVQGHESQPPNFQQLAAEGHGSCTSSYLLESWLRACSRLPLLFQNRPFM